MSVFLLRSAQRSAQLFTSAQAALTAAGIKPRVVTITSGDQKVSASDLNKYVLSEESKKQILATSVSQIVLDGATLAELKAAGAIAAAPLANDHLQYVVSELGLDSRIVQPTNAQQAGPYSNLANITSITNVSDSWASTKTAVEQLQHFSPMLSASERDAREQELKETLNATLQKAKTAAGGEAFTVLEDNSGDFTPVTNALIRKIAAEQGLAFNTKSVRAAINELLVFPERFGTVVGTSGNSSNFARLVAGLGGGYSKVPIRYTNGSSELHTAFPQDAGNNPQAFLLAVAAALQKNGHNAEAQKLQQAARK